MARRPSFSDSRRAALKRGGTPNLVRSHRCRIESRVIIEEFELDVIRSATSKENRGYHARVASLFPERYRRVVGHFLAGRCRDRVGGQLRSVVAIAALRGIPSMLLEQNAVPGLTNKLLAPLVKRAAVTYDASLKFFGRKGFVSGNPVRQEFLEVDDAAIDARKVRVLVFGGSQGAHAINVAVVEAAPRLAAAADTLDLVCQTGARDLDMVRTAFERNGVQGRVERFSDARARDESRRAVVSRAGATTLAEVTRLAAAILFLSDRYCIISATTRWLKREAPLK